MQTFRRFVELWCSEEYAPILASVEEIAAAERKLRVRIPNTYREALLTVGVPRLRSELLNAIVKSDAAFHDVSEFFALNEIVRVTEDWRGLGLSPDVFAFASDCQGNLFCWGADGSEPVWFFDHDSRHIGVIASDFATWIGSYEVFAGEPPEARPLHRSNVARH